MQFSSMSTVSLNQCSHINLLVLCPSLLKNSSSKTLENYIKLFITRRR